LEGWWWEQETMRDGRYQWRGPRRRPDISQIYDIGNNTNNGMMYYYTAYIGQNNSVLYQAWRIDLPGPNPNSAPRYMTFGNNYEGNLVSCGQNQTDPQYQYPIYCPKITWKRYDGGAIGNTPDPGCVFYGSNGFEGTSFLCPAITRS